MKDLLEARRRLQVDMNEHLLDELENVLALTEDILVNQKDPQVQGYAKDVQALLERLHVNYLLYTTDNPELNFEESAAVDEYIEGLRVSEGFPYGT